MLSKKIPYMLFSLIFILSLNAAGGELSPELRDILSAKSADETIPVIIELKETDDLDRLKTELAQAETRADRHRLAVNTLQNSHRRAQSALMDRLERLSLDKKAANVKSYWIVNAVAAEITAEEIVELAERDDIDIISTVPEIFIVSPEDDETEYFSPSGADSVTSNLTYVKADQAHAAGYTGAGRLVCSFDTGVDGEHPALKSRWKGLDGDSAASWFFALDDLNYPHTIATSTNPNHGTHTMGIMTGHNESIDYTVGVAPGAKWISAAVIDISGTSILDAFEWAADPDGDPNTLDDVPDVINHSWGYVKEALACENVFFDAIDNTELLGIVNIFAAGNTGADTMIYNPANRAFDSLDCFAVGNLNTTISPAALWSSSSRGPSDCPGGGTKPNVVAPGRSIRSLYPNSSYGTMTGTSMSAPHVSGLVALLRQKNPDATVAEIKNAILLSTQTETTFGSLPNNSYGWGAIDCMQALAALNPTNTEPNVRVFDFDHAPIVPGDTVVGTVVLRNTGAAVTNISALLSGSNSDLTIISGSAYFGAIGEGDTVRSDDTIRVIVSDTITEGSVLSLDFNIMGTGYDVDAKLYFIVEPTGSKALATHNTGRVQFTLSNFGVLGLGGGSLYPAGGEGFRFNGAVNDLWEGGLILGRSSAEVSSGVHTMIFEPDNDFVVAPGGDMQFFTPSEKAPQQSFCAFQDDNGDNPLNVRIEQESFSFSSPDDDFIIVRYTLTNNNSYTLTNVRLGMFMDWDIPSYAYNAGGYDDGGDYAWQAYNSGSTLSPILSN
ncbi:MAG: S8 family peptidase, partial [Candidatus Zixiibacteriota bacterium]